MNIVDANVLLYAVNLADPKHDASKAWLDDALNESESVGFTWIVLLAFLRLSTKAGLFPRPLTVAEAVSIMRTWLEQPASVVVEPTNRHLDLLAGLLIDAGTGANLTSDAHLAALAMEHGATIVSHDRDFDRFAVFVTSPRRDIRVTQVRERR